MTEDNKEKIHEGLVIYTIGGQKYELRELKIKKVKRLAEDIFILHSDLQKKLQEKKNEENADVLEPEFFEGINLAIVKVINFLFGLEGEGQLTSEWMEENISYRILEDIVKEASAMSRMEWLPPFFGTFCQTASSMIPLTVRKNNPNGKPTI